MTIIYNKVETKEKRRKLRNGMTEAEKILWEELRRDKLGYRFRRQYGISQYIVDFYCPKLKIVIEVDGKYHNRKEVKEYDLERERELVELGMRILRFENKVVLKEIDKVIEKINSFLCMVSS